MTRASEILNTPRVQGSLQAFNGLIETTVTSQLHSFPRFSLPAKTITPNESLSTRYLPSFELHSWNNSINPFRGKIFKEIDYLFLSRGFTTKGPNPLERRGSYFHPITS